MLSSGVLYPIVTILVTIVWSYWYVSREYFVGGQFLSNTVETPYSVVLSVYERLRLSSKQVASEYKGGLGRTGTRIVSKGER